MRFYVIEYKVFNFIWVNIFFVGLSVVGCRNKDKNFERKFLRLFDVLSLNFWVIIVKVSEVGS